MDRFNKLPPVQKLAVMIGTMAALGGLIWFALISDLSDQKLNHEGQVQTMKAAAAKLKGQLSKEKIESRDKDKQRLEDEKKRFESMLPTQTEIENFITGISETAKNAGLSLLSFEKGNPIDQDFYVEIPLTMEVKGTYRVLIGFLRQMADKDRRVVNVRNLNLEVATLPVEDYLKKYEDERTRSVPDGQAPRPLTDVQKLMQLVRANEEAVQEGAQLTAKFQTFVFIYTGKPVPPEMAQRNAQKLEERRRRRLTSVRVL